MNKEKIIGDVLTATEFLKLKADLSKHYNNVTPYHIVESQSIIKVLELVNGKIWGLSQEVSEYQKRKYEMEEHKKLIESKIGDKK